MTQQITDAYDALLLDYASGALPLAPTLLVQAHLRLRPDALGFVAAADAIGGLLLEGAPPAAMRSGPRTHVTVVPETAGPDPYERALARVTHAVSSDKLDWRWRGPGLREHRLPLDGARLLKIPAGGAMPAHGHSGEEMTLVLRGAFEDEHGAYGPGDIAFADEGVEHTPRVRGGADCVCLVVMNGDFRFRTFMGRLAGQLFS